MSEPTDEEDGLSEYERQFVEAYMGEAAGCGARAVQLVSGVEPRSAATIASRLLRRPHVRKALRAREESDPLVMNRVERLRLYTRIARGKEPTERVIVGKRGRRAKVQDMPTLRERLEALQTLSKICGDFLPPLEDAGEGSRAAGMTLDQLFARMLHGGQVQ